ncbi:MAG TPA: DUF533 domain-containing protein [Phycisphaerae bacterium]|nr:DUF533 domain-containing protein [Phycisphaerae bacterium]HRY70770.1 DUF533 domain-containing protein [Phycisphaerae bacterium]HSA28886.1 DUF533 domain-containing protein [Phycisphaerae bacterium]
MAGALDILGSLLSGGMTKSAPGRIEHSLSEKGVGGQGGFLDQILGGVRPQAAPPQAQNVGAASGLGGALGSILGDSGTLKVGGLGALAGAILGGGAKGAIGGGALALLGSLALKAMQGARAGQMQHQQIDPAAQLVAGLRAPSNQQEGMQVESQAELLVDAMINAAKADGQIDQQEIERIATKVETTGDSRERLIEKLRKPMDTDRIARSATSPQLAVQVYAASLLAIEVDTEAEKQYLADLAGRLRLDPGTVQRLHAALGVA